MRGDRIVVPAKLSVDFCGPMASGDIALIFYPQYARYPVVEFEESKSEKSSNTDNQEDVRHIWGAKRDQIR